MRRHTTMDSRGFSLIEMAVVLFIVVLLLGSLLVPFATQVEQRRIAETQKSMEEIKEALIGFAITNSAVDGRPRLPCPDNNNDGIAETPSPATNLCPAGTGLPWATLGVANADAWGNRFAYYVTPEYARSNPGISLGPPATGGNANVCRAANCGAGTFIAQNVPAVIISFGRNGYGAINANRAAGDLTRIPCPGAAAECSPDETENLNGNSNFVSRTTTPANAPAGEFDDVVAWVSTNVLFSRLVAAQKLP